jgi:large repetitive protein
MIPNFFTPISDGWTPLKIDNFRDIETKVFDRYGREIAILKRGEKWDGNYKNNPLPSGDYWYIVDVKDGTGRTFVGNVTLYR